MFVFICIQICSYVCMYTHIQITICEYHMYLDVNTCMCIYRYTHMHAHYIPVACVRSSDLRRCVVAWPFRPEPRILAHTHKTPNHQPSTQSFKPKRCTLNTPGGRAIPLYPRVQ